MYLAGSSLLHAYRALFARIICTSSFIYVFSANCEVAGRKLGRVVSPYLVTCARRFSKKVVGCRRK